MAALGRRSCHMMLIKYAWKKQIIISVFDRFNGLSDIDTRTRFTRLIQHSPLYFGSIAFYTTAAAARVRKSMFILLIHSSNGVFSLSNA